MKSTYQEIDLEQFGKVLKRTDENGQEWFIPTDPANSDYQRYLRWLENPDADEFPTIEVTND
jgi:hypothetical protein